MQFFKLDSAYKPGDTVHDFESLVWVERYQDSGDFQLVVANEVNVLGEFPLGTLVSHTDTREVMIVENHEVKRGTDKSLKILISGRSFETFAENRLSPASYLPVVDSVTGDRNVDTTITGSAESVAVTLLSGQLKPGVATADNAVPNLNVLTELRLSDPSMAFSIKRGTIYERVLELLRLSGSGVKTVRPLGAETTLDIVIYDGLDLTDQVVFYSQTGDLEDGNYFWSLKDYKNYAQIAAHIHARLYRDRGLGSDLTGLNRRITYVEADDLENAYPSPSNTDEVASRGQLELDDHKVASLLSAKIATTAKPKFKIDYDVGDILTVYGEFGLSAPRRVTEHILTIDKDGLRGYPTLSAL